MSGCSAIGCTYRSKRNKNILFHRVPSEKQEKVILSANDTKYKVNRKLTISEGLFTCDFHFGESCSGKDLTMVMLALLYFFKFC